MHPPHPDPSSLVGTRHPTAHIDFPPLGLQPYHDWLLNTLDRLAAASLGDLRVTPDDTSPTHVAVTPGRCTIAGNRLAFPGATLDLAPHNNSTAHVWLINDNGTPTAQAGPAADGWPATDHIRLAEATLTNAAITTLTDRRAESILTA